MDVKICCSDKDPINGKEFFFTEESFNKYSRIPNTLEERLLWRITKLNGDKDVPGSVSDSNKICTSEVPDLTLAAKEKQEVTTACSQPIDIKESQETKGKPVKKRQDKQKHADEIPKGYKVYIPPPPKSRLKHDQQKRYLYLYKKYSHKTRLDTTEEERSELHELQNLTKIVLEEQKEYQDYQELLANKAHRAEYQYMHPAAKKYIEEYLNFRKKEVEKYPKYYSMESNFPIQGEGQPSKLVYIKSLLQLGIVPKMILPNLAQHPKPEVPLESPAISEQYPSRIPKAQNPKVWNHEACSEDSNAEHLATLHKAHVVISSAALQCLIDNHAPKYLEEWELPVTVREYEERNEEKITVHRIVFIDKPFASKKSTVREKYSVYFKRALKAFILKPSQKGHVFGNGPATQPKQISMLTKKQQSTQSSDKCELQRINENVKIEESLEADLTSMDDLECFGTGSGKTKLNSEKESDMTVFDNMEASNLDELESFGNISSFKNLKNSGKSKAKETDEDLLQKLKKMHKPASKSTSSHSAVNMESSKEEIKKKETESLNPSEPKTALDAKNNTEMLPIIPWHTPDPLNSDLQKDEFRKCRKKKCSLRFADPDELDIDSSCEDDDKLYIDASVLEDSPSKNKTMEIFEEAPASPTPASPDPMEEGDHVCKIIPMGSDYSPEKIQGPVVDRESPLSPEKNPAMRTVEMLQCKIIPLARESEEENHSEGHLSVDEGMDVSYNVKVRNSDEFKDMLDEHDSEDSADEKLLIDVPELGSKTSSRNEGGKTKKSLSQLRKSSIEEIPSEMNVKCEKGEMENATKLGEINKTNAMQVQEDENMGDTVDSSDDDEVVIQKKKCRKAVLESDNESDQDSIVKEENVAPQVKRKRGRPRKVPIGEKNIASQGKISADSEKTEKDTSHMGTSGPGIMTRSRRSTSAVSDTSEKDVKAELRKSPRKSKVSNSSNNDNTVDMNILDASKCDNGIVPVESQIPGITLNQEDSKESSDITNTNDSMSSTGKESVTCVQKKRQSEPKESLLGTIGSRKRMSRVGSNTHFGKPKTEPNSKPVLSTVDLKTQKVQETKDSAKQKTEDRFNIDSLLNMQQKLHLSNQDTVDHQDIADAGNYSYKVPEHRNVTYHLWGLGGFQVIVRCGIHGFVRDLNQQLSFIHVMPKLEYQSYYGLEQVTKSEVARAWISSYIRPNCRLIRARINTQKSEILSLEELPAGQAMASTQIFNPANAFLMLQNIFHKLHQLSAGRYLLQHVASSNKCVIKKSSSENKRGSYDLHFNHLGFVDNFGNIQNMKVPWVPLDPTVLLTYHTTQGRIPVTFDPPDFKFTYSNQTKAIKRKKKNKGKKNKNKESNKQNN